MKWENKTVNLQVQICLPEDFEVKEINKFTNQFGESDWKIVSTTVIFPCVKEIISVFKRPLPEQSE